jgi:hypothetical protein
VADAVTITITSVDRTHVIPYKEGPGNNSSITISETAPGVATMSASIWDQTNSITISENAEITVSDPTTPGNLVFNGYITSRKVRVQAN